MEIDETLEHLVVGRWWRSQHCGRFGWWEVYLRDIHGYEVFRELAKSFAYIIQRTVFTVFEDNIEIFPGFHKPLILYDVRVLERSY